MRPLPVYEERTSILLLLIVALLATPFVLYYVTSDWRAACVAAVGPSNGGTTELSRWADRFVTTAVVQAVLATGLTSYLLYRGIFGKPAASRIIAAGGAGNWLTAGYLGYIILGLLGTAVTSLFYRHIEADLGHPYVGWTNLLAWAHLLLMNIGVVGATWLMIHAGYRGGAAAIDTRFGGLGYTAGQLHVMLKHYPPYIAIFMAIAVLGAIVGAVGYAVALLPAPSFVPGCG